VDVATIISTKCYEIKNPEIKILKATRVFSELVCFKTSNRLE
jgi:hypothetical protein